MFRTRTFLRKTKKGGILKVVREHYLRDDIVCGSEICTICKQNVTLLDSAPVSDSKLITQPHYILPDTNVVLHQVSLYLDF